MEFKLNRESVPATETIYDGIQEQSVELDYILPDYYPDIFRIVRCEVTPCITDYSVSGSRLAYELQCDIRMIYCSEDGSALQCINQRQTFSRSAELGRDPGNVSVRLVPKADHMNYRAVNKRRLDLRGAVSVKISVTGEKRQEVVSDASGMNIQLRKVPVRFASASLSAEKNVQLSEDIELSAAQSPVTGIIRCKCTVSGCEKKLISGKLMVKGELSTELLCACGQDGSVTVESMDLTLPFSQIIDMDGLDDTFECSISPEVVSCDVTPAAGRNGENRLLHFEAELRLTCRAVRASSVMICTDAYSTLYPCEVSVSEITTEQLPVVYDREFRCTAVLAEGESLPDKVFAVWCTPKNINTHASEGGTSLMISGMLTYSTAARDASGMITISDKDEAFEGTADIGEDLRNCRVTADISAGNVDYNISPEGVMTGKADISARISVAGCERILAVTDISVDDSAKKSRDGDYSIKLYFGSENEEIWDIAKRYSTDVNAVMEENDLSGERLEKGSMLLIPIIT